jgi:HEPN domain-containing protein
MRCAKGSSLPKRDTRDLARVIATNAERDAVAVERMARDPELADDIVGLHAQQAAEKYLKAVLSFRSITYRRVHSITYLLGVLADHDVASPPRASELEAFTPWAPQARYDHDTDATLDREAAVELVRGVRTWAEAQLRG